MSDEKQEWVMPEWMEPYRDLFANTGGNSIERLVNLPASTGKTNIILSTLACCAESQLTLLGRLRNRDMLVPIATPSDIAEADAVLREYGYLADNPPEPNKPR